MGVEPSTFHTASSPADQWTDTKPSPKVGLSVVDVTAERWMPRSLGRHPTSHGTRYDVAQPATPSAAGSVDPPTA
jgi:hypothetical protein